MLKLVSEDVVEPRAEGLRLTSSPRRGEGVFATRAFRPGETVLVGVIETLLHENHSHASQIGDKQFALHAGLTSKFNHSCHPNCGIRINSSGAHDFVAMRDIAAGDEATFDYAMRNFTVEHFPSICMCGAKDCRGTISGWCGLSAATKAKYSGFVAPYLLEMDSLRAAKRNELKIACQGQEEDICR